MKWHPCDNIQVLFCKKLVDNNADMDFEGLSIENIFVYLRFVSTKCQYCLNLGSGVQPLSGHIVTNPSHRSTRRANFRIENKLVRRDNVVKTGFLVAWSYEACLTLFYPRGSLFAEVCSAGNTVSVYVDWNAKTRLLVSVMPAVSIPTALWRFSDVIPGQWLLIFFIQFFILTIIKLCSHVLMRHTKGYRFCCAHAASDFRWPI